jgi:hypothetical protein
MGVGVEDPMAVQQRIQEQPHVQETAMARLERIGRQKSGFEVLVEQPVETQPEPTINGCDLQHELAFFSRLVGEHGLNCKLKIVESVYRQLMTRGEPADEDPQDRQRDRTPGYT